MHKEHQKLSDQLLKWYYLNHRDLPWRKTNDPFKIWLSEIILQQTRVAQGLPYYEKFVTRFDNVQQFADADEAEVLKLWQGLGYYSRARNMQHCAKTVVSEYDGSFPNSFKELLKLKGIGKYTAAAIASICFEERVPSIDGNLYRVLSRLFGIKDDISDAKSYKVFFEQALQIMPKSNCGDFNQSLMELGATVCLPKQPKCDICPIREFCFANAKINQEEFPVKSKKVKIRTRRFDYHVVKFKNSVLIQKRTKKDIWTGLNQFLLIEDGEVELDFQAASKLLTSDIFRHQLTHQKLNIQFHVWEVNETEFNRVKKKFGMRSIDISEIGNFAVPKPIEQFLKNEYLLVN